MGVTLKMSTITATIINDKPKKQLT